MADILTLGARWVFPVTRPPIERGRVTVADDCILNIDPGSALQPDIDFGNAAIVPGFVNAHTHLDLTGAKGLTPPTPDFVDWLRRVIAFRRGRTPEQVQADVQAGLAELTRHGTTLVGDIAAEGATWDALANAPLRAIVFRELLGLTEERAAVAWEGFQWWRDSVAPTETCRPGISPHAPYSVAETLYEQAVEARLPLATHVAETRAEIDLLGERCGPFVPFLRDLGVWAPDRLVGDVNRVVQLANVVDPHLLVHCNYLSANAPISFLGTVVYCPRTHAAFGHPPHPFREFLANGVLVALGTDSLASNPDLSVLAEARFLHTRCPDFPGNALLKLATLNGAKALGWADQTGSLDEGKSADFAVVALPDHDAADPYQLLFDSDLPVVATWFRGREVHRSPLNGSPAL
jgi:cytosine/adenosine deaminase-related metal-dependent hydrolase